VALATRDLCRAARAETGIVDVCLAGGAFMNRRLLVLSEHALVADGFRVHLSQEAPLNDGGLAYGQAVIARARLTGEPEGAQTLRSSDFGRGDPHVRRFSRHDSRA
jgi:hydrogenase maturation factor HypF (carbamoyltransferase family)